MLLAITVLLAIVAVAIYITNRKSKSTSIIEEPKFISTIHDEIAKTIEVTKIRSEVSDESPIRECIDLYKDEPKAKKIAPKMNAKPKQAPKPSTQAKPKAPKKKTVNA